MNKLVNSQSEQVKLLPRHISMADLPFHDLINFWPQLQHLANPSVKRYFFLQTKQKNITTSKIMKQESVKP